MFKCARNLSCLNLNCLNLKLFLLAETIQICVDALYGGELIPPDYPKEIFVELINSATTLVEFNFNNMYKQIDGVAMGSPLSVAIANIFIGYHKGKLFESTTKPFLYHQYVDDTFAIFGSEEECTSFLDALNSMHSASKFTFEKEENDQLPFLDALVEKSNEGFLTSQFSENLLLLDRTFIGIRLDLQNVKPI